MIRRFFIFFLLMFVATNCIAQVTAINPDGFDTIYFPNGSIQSYGLMRHGKPDGYWKTFYSTGVIKSEGNRKNFLLDSTWIFYGSTGDTINKISYLLGKKNGYFFTYNTDRSRPEYIGKVISKELYVNDKKEGLSYYYYPDGKLKETVSYTDDRKDGNSIEHAPDGRIITIKQYSKGALVERQKINRYNDQQQKVGEWEQFYEGLKVKVQANYVKGLLDGYYKEYDSNGKLLLTLLYDNGKLVKQINETENAVEIKEKKDSLGNVIESGPYIDSIPVGLHRKFDTTGKVIGSRIYDNTGVLLSVGIVDMEGKRSGNWVDYFRNGAKKATGRYKNNLRQGQWTFFFPNGKIEQEGSYVNGKEVGTWTWYHADGNVWRTEEYLNGKRDGHYIEYNKNGKVITEGDYVDGEREGPWTVAINHFSAKGKYTDGLRDGKWKYYYGDGTLMFEGGYIQGSPEGKHSYYYPNGKLREEQFYVSGIPAKNWRKFDDQGNLVLTITYEDGREYRINGEKIQFPDDKTLILQ